ncbi:serine/threonine protein kinase [Cystobacter ferrugineus]|uniref:Serine/threonine protein kinase n=2 Tax=Cystobacter ferrugineus TaxID=83449 RepID=A0A1L9BHN0_9BACT|nr:serine/threonine protein kinase [Cystobacter ferrugineus]
MVPVHMRRSLPVLLLCLSSCATTPGNVSLRSDGTPGPEECPQKALEAMRILGLSVGDAAEVELDVNQTDASPITLYDGPVESMLNSPLGPFPSVSRLYGRVWTGGPQAVIRYYEVQPPEREPIPICAVARLGLGQLRKKPESKPGTAILEFSSAALYIVNSFR